MSESKPIRILYMEDDRGLARLAQKRLEPAGYIVDIALDGQEGLATYEAGSYDVVVVDQSMPVYDGLQVIRLLAAQGPLPPMIMVTGTGNEEIAVEALKLGARDYIVKDVEGGYLDLLPSVIERVLQQQRLDEERRQALEALRESEEKYRTILGSIEEGYYEVDIAGNFTFFNDSLCRLLGYPEDELMGMNNRQYMDAENARKVYQTFNAIYRTGKPAEAFDWEVIRKDGTRRFVEASVSLIRGSTGEPVGFRGIVRDITERKRAEREIEERRMYLEGVLGAAPDAIVTLDAGHRIVEWNPGAERLFGYSQEEAIGRNIDHLITNPDTFEEAVGLTQMVVSGKEVPPTETVRYREDGSPVDVIVAGSPILVGDEFIGVVAIYTDITARVRMEEALRALALVDDLTGLYNRRGFLTLAQQQLKTANRARRSMVLLFADFNGLKQINDTLGHLEGDRALIETADVLRETFRESDILARIGGDEFVVLAIETDRVGPEILVTRLQENLEAHNAGEGRRYKLSLSVGLARYDSERSCSIDELLAQADRAMYEQKRGDQRS